jgi:hypothetical protein
VLTVAAFDPGNSPSAAVYRGDDRFVLFQPMGVGRSITRRRKNEDGVMRDKKGVTNTPDVPALLNIYRDWLPDIAVIEQVSAMSAPQKDGTRIAQGLASTASLMHAAGLLEGIAYGVSLNGITRLIKIRPQVWRRAWAMPVGKEQSRLVATRLFPSRASDFTLVKSHNVSDPLLMAVYVWHHETGTPLPGGAASLR